MNILMVMPKFPKYKHVKNVQFSLGICYVAASLKRNGFSVFTLNLNHEEYTSIKPLQKNILENDINVIMTGGLSAEYNVIKEVIILAKYIKPEIITVVGGGMVSADPINPMKGIKYDIGVIGEADISIVKLAEALENKDDISSVKGIAYWKDNEVICTSGREDVENLDKLPFPDIEGFGFAKNLSLSEGKQITISASRSCPYNCTFCFHPSGVKYRQRSLDSVFDELDYFLRLYQIEFITFIDELFASNVGRLVEFSKRIKKYNIKWGAQMRVDNVEEELLEIVKDAGCVIMGFGLESADNSILKSMRKNTTKEQIENALRLCKKIGLTTGGNFIFGDINETKKTFNNTIKSARDHKAQLISFAKIITFPGTTLYGYALENNIINDEVKFLEDGCPVVNVSKMSNEEFEEMGDILEEIAFEITSQEVFFDPVKYYSDKENVLTKITCPKCGNKNIRILSYWTANPVQCSSCGVNYRLSPIKSFHLGKTDVFDFLLKAESVGIWGAGGILRKWMIADQLLRESGIPIFDKDCTKIGKQVYSSKIYGVKDIEEMKIKTVVISSVLHEDEIIREIRENFKFIEKILIMDLKKTFGMDEGPYYLKDILLPQHRKEERLIK